MKLPDGPKTAPFLQMLNWMADPLTVMESCAERYGDIFTLQFGKPFREMVLLSNPPAIQEIFNADAKNFDSGKGNAILRPLLGDRSIALLDGDRHRRQRQLLMPPFHGERMRAYGELIRNLTLGVAGQWQKGKPLCARESMQKITMRAILQAVFGLSEGPRCQQLEQLISARLNATSSLLGAPLIFFPSLQKDLGPWSPWGRVMHMQRQIDRLIYAEIQDRRLQPDGDRTDILSLLLSARDEAGEGMTDVELRDELITLLVAGHETTATALSWALYWIHHIPAVRDRLREELATLGDDPDPSDIFRLPYLNAVCSETLRIYPVGMLAFPRIVRSPLELMGFQFEPGTAIAVCIYLTHQREDIYPEPKQFKPERFLEKQFSPYEFLPFGGGNRRCIGMAFAQFEMKVVLATILSRFELAIADSKPVKPVRRGVTIAPSGGVQLVVVGERLRQGRAIAAVS